MQIIYDFVKIFCLCDSQFHVSFIQVFLCMCVYSFFMYYIIIVNSVLSRDRHSSLHEHRWMHLISPLDARGRIHLSLRYTLICHFIFSVVLCNIRTFTHTTHTFYLYACHDRWLVAFRRGVEFDLDRQIRGDFPWHERDPEADVCT